MTKLVVDPTLQAKLTGPVELCDNSGRTFGFFLTREEYERFRQWEEEQRRLDYAHAQSLFTDEELAEDEKDTETFTTEEVIRYLESL
jgi:hypothetical protein